MADLGRSCLCGTYIREGTLMTASLALWSADIRWGVLLGVYVLFPLCETTSLRVGGEV